jgi:hypothetical protein
MSKTYTVGTSERGRPTIVLQGKDQLSFSAWRDIHRICGKSWDEGEKAVFECLLPERVTLAEKTLVAYGWKREQDPSQDRWSYLDIEGELPKR